MRITVFGAAGAVGSRVVTEALSRGHHVTAVVRDPARYRAPQLVPAHPGAALTVGAGDASDLTDALRLSTGQDLVITATRPAPGREDDLVTTTKTLLAAARASATRLLVVGGAATLTVPGSGGATVLDDPVPPARRIPPDRPGLRRPAGDLPHRHRHRHRLGLPQPRRAAAAGRPHRRLPARRRRTPPGRRRHLRHLHGRPRRRPPRRGRTPPPPPHQIHRRLLTHSRDSIA
ncbi:NAD(P)-dependent oxidoreductase [Nonomuraea africana]|uniref:NAD(P)-dependent oxidoreductase n=1 Tax=Nonomuraea africana TaxID=46171 RepID=UPI003408D362